MLQIILLGFQLDIIRQTSATTHNTSASFPRERRFIWPSRSDFTGCCALRMQTFLQHRFAAKDGKWNISAHSYLYDFEGSENRSCSSAAISFTNDGLLLLYMEYHNKLLLINPSHLMYSLVLEFLQNLTAKNQGLIVNFPLYCGTEGWESGYRWATQVYYHQDVENS